MPVTTTRRLGFAASVAILAVLSSAPAAVATQGSVPPEVTTYTTDSDGMVTRLNDVFGVGADGVGIDFDETTKAGPLSRVFEWTDGFFEGEDTETPLTPTNFWVTSISVRDSTVGLATIWINEATVAPELATFERGAALGEAFLGLPAEAYLVRDEDRGAWFTLEGTTLTPVRAGESGISASTPLSVYRNLVSGRDQESTAEPVLDQGLLASAVTVGLLVLIVAALLLLPLGRRRMAKARLGRVAPVAEDSGGLRG